MSKTIKVDKFKAEIEKSIRDALKKTDFIITEIEFHYFLSLFNTYQFIKNYVKKKFDLDFVFQAEFGFKIEDLEEEFKQLHPRVWERHQGELKPLFVLHKFSGSKLDRAYGKVFKIKEWCDGMKKKKQKRFSTIFPSLETQKARMKKSKSPSYAEKVSLFSC